MNTNDWQQQLKIAGKAAVKREEERREKEQKAKEEQAENAVFANEMSGIKP